MQNKYVADVGDFGKCGILRALCRREPSLSLGVVWCLVSDGRRNDGGFVSYLDGGGDRFSACDPELYEALAGIFHSNRRTVADVREHEILGADATFFEELVPRHDRDRKQWLARALQATASCEVVFLDPDNGLKRPDERHPQLRGPKHVFLDELEPFFARKQSLVIYHHLGRQCRHDKQITDWAGQLAELLHPPGGPFALHWHRGTARAFFVVPASSRHGRILRQRAQGMVDGPWGRHGHLSGVCDLCGP